MGRPAGLTNLLFQILIMYASTHDLINGVETRPTLASIRAGAALGEFQIDKLCVCAASRWR